MIPQGGISLEKPIEQSSPWRVLTPAFAKQIDDKLAVAVKLSYAVVELIIEKGRPRWIRGPAPSEPVQMQ